MKASAFFAAVSSVLLNPSFAFSSHFDPGGSPLSELSWPSSLAVVAVSFSGLFTFVLLMLACLCCKKEDVSFKEFQNTGSEDLSTLASADPQTDAEVYILPLTEVSLPVSKQPGQSFQLLKSNNLGRRSLFYIKEIGQGWFGKVLVGEVNAGLGNTQVVVKELKANASAHEQKRFLEEAKPYRILQHPALLQCLAQCSELTPYLLVMEHCSMGDVKGYLRSCRAAESVLPEPLTLQRMACEIASGLLYLHKHNYIHSDLALRNCLLTSELAVKIGDYGLSHSKYKDDYYVTADLIWVPLRWIAPELIDEVHGNLLMVDQTKASNVWSLGVTIWELLELGNQPYRHYSDKQVLTYAVKEEQLKLPKPLLKVPLSDRWYEVMQFCWLQPEQRPVVEEVHLLLNYLCAKGATEAEEDFEKRWDSLKPSLDCNSTLRTPVAEVVSSACSSFPLLEQFSIADNFQSENGDDILTVTETSQGLNFEYKWEQARAEQPYCSSSASGPLGKSNPLYQDVYYPLNNSGSCKSESLPLGVSPSYYESDHPGVVPVLSAHSPSISSEYYIRIEEPVECNIQIEDTNLDESPEVGKTTLSSRSPINAQSSTYWSAAKEPISYDYDSDCCLTMEPLQRRVEDSVSTDQSEEVFPSSHGHSLQESELDFLQSHGSECNQNKRRSEDLCHQSEVGRESPFTTAVSLSSPSLARCDPYLESNQRKVEKNIGSETYYDMMGSSQNNAVRPPYRNTEVATDDGLVLSRVDSEEESDLLCHNLVNNWNSNHSANNNSSSNHTNGVGFCDAYLDVRHPTPSSHIGNWKIRASDDESSTLKSAESLKGHTYMEAPIHTTPISDKPHIEAGFGGYINLCPQSNLATTSEGPQRETQHNISQKPIECSAPNVFVRSWSSMNSSMPTEILKAGEKLLRDTRISTFQNHEPAFDAPAKVCVTMVPCPKRFLGCDDMTHCRMVDHSTSVSLLGINGCNDEVVTNIHSGIFANYPLKYTEISSIERIHRPLLEEIGSSHHKEPINLASSSSPTEAFSLDGYSMSIHPKSLDSGYDTENNESPEFILKDPEDNPELSISVGSDEIDMFLQMDIDEDVNEINLHHCNPQQQKVCHNEGNPYRDSAYFSDFDMENEKSPSVDDTNFFQGNGTVFDIESKHLTNVADKVEHTMHSSRFEVDRHEGDSTMPSLQIDLKTLSGRGQSPNSSPIISMLSPFPPEMGGCLTKESTPDDGIGLESDHSGDEPVSECYSSTVSEGSSSTQEASCIVDQANCDTRHYSSAESIGSDSTIVEFSGELTQEEEQEVSNKIDNSDILKEGNEENNVNERPMEATSKPKRDESLENILPPLPDNLDVRAPLGNTEEADEEDSDDSDESDEELRSYNIQQSDESDEELPVVPVVVSDRSNARHLRSLLKIPSILAQTFSEEMESKKKAVSFFDDVTVFLFDQESPTGELGDYAFPADGETNGQLSEHLVPPVSEDPPGTNVSEESGAFQWQDSFPLMLSPSTSEPSSDEIPTPPNSPMKSPDVKPATPISRFSISRFSITQVSDSDMDYMEGQI